MFPHSLKYFFLDDDDIHYEEVEMAPDAVLEDLLKELKKTYTDSHMFMNNDLTELQDDDKLEEIYDDGDIFTAFRTGPNKPRAQTFKNDSEAVLVLQDKAGNPMFIKSGTEEKYKWKLTNFDRTITVFRYI